ncbi:MAG: serine/threonine-protein phosphatase [bacterium]|nr:serine/threonine-protein phosphatase [bacterium]
MRALIVDPETALPQGVESCLEQDGWDVSRAADYRHAMEIAQTGDITAAIIPHLPDGVAGRSGELDYRDLMRVIDTRHIATVLISPDPAHAQVRDESLVDVAGADVTNEEIRGRLATIRRYHRVVKNMEGEVENLQRLSKRINQHFKEVDQEMRLAGRLQRDFLPRDLGTVNAVRFAPLYRPVTWVSGDIYDVFRIDETHVGFYVADAVGHGMAASLLTMFIKHAVIPKEITSSGYRIIEPDEVLERLNTALAQQALPNCQFVTTCYCLLNTETLELRFARGGHPYPLLITADGCITELKAHGGLMGLFPEATFEVGKVQMQPGEKLILYTDGVEVSFAPREDEAHAWEHYRSVFERLAHEPVDEIVRRLEAELDSETGSLNPTDDVTIVAMQILSQ